MADLGTISLGSPVSVGQATQVRRSLSVSPDQTTGNSIVIVRACLCDASGKMLGNAATYATKLEALSQATQDAISAAMTACYDDANAANPIGFPK